MIKADSTSMNWISAGLMGMIRGPFRARSRSMRLVEGYPSETRMVSRSKNAGCMRRSPASHCWNARRDVCSLSAHQSCASVIPQERAACTRSRSATTSVGLGLRDGEPPRERFGWLDILGADARHQGVDGGDLVPAVRRVAQELRQFGQQRFGLGGGLLAGGGIQGDHAATELCGEVVEFDLAGDGVGHFRLQPLVPEARLSCIDSSNNTLNARICKKNIFMGGRVVTYDGSEPSNEQEDA